MAKEFIGLPFGTKEERIALIESVNNIVATIGPRLHFEFQDHKDYAQKIAEMYYTMYNEIIKNARHE